MGPDSITLHLIVPAEGGAPIRLFCIELMDLDQNETRVVKHTRNAQDAGESLTARIPSLKPGGAFIFRVRAESEVWFCFGDFIMGFYVNILRPNA